MNMWIRANSALAAAAFCALTAPVGAQESSPSTRPDQPAARPPASVQEQSQGQETRATDKAAIGIMSADRGGEGVRITGLAPDGPAERTGLQVGDVIVSADQKPIRNIADLQRVLQAKKPMDLVSFSVQRRNERRDFGVQLVAASELAPPRQENAGRPGGFDDAWLGVQLARGDERGVVVADVFPAGPAAMSGLWEGDQIRSFGGTAVTSVEQFMGLVREKRAGDKVPVEVLRNNNQLAIEVELGRRGEHYPFEDADESDRADQADRSTYRFEQIPEYAMRLEEHRRLAKQNERLEDLTLQLLREIRQLQQDVQALRAERGGATSTPNGPAAETP